jgi:hypothetical protein
MAQNPATVYNKSVVERFNRKSITAPAFSLDWAWDGNKTINATSVSVPTMNDYDRTANSNRFGTPTEVDLTGQTLTVLQDRGREQLVDFGNLADSNNAAAAGKHLKRVIDEVITPEIDTYRLTVLGTAGVAGTQKIGTTAATDGTTAYSNFLLGQAILSDALVPETGRVAFMTATYRNFLKTGGFLLASDNANEARKNGNLGTVDGVEIVVVPASWMPTNIDLILVHNSVALSPMKLKNYRVLEGQQGYDANILQWRFYYDAFVLTAKAKGVAAHQTA